MNRMLASGLGVTLGLMTATGTAQEANWRAAKSQPPQRPSTAQEPPAPVTLALTPIAAVAIAEPVPVPAAPVPAPCSAHRLGYRDDIPPDRRAAAGDGRRLRRGRNDDRQH